MKQDTFLILKLLINFFKELVVCQWSFLAKCTGLIVVEHHEEYFCENILNLRQWIKRRLRLSIDLTALLFATAEPFVQFW